MRQRIIGPVRGYYLVAGCLVSGELADLYRGWGRVYRSLPGSVFDSGHVLSVQAEAEHRRAEDALNAAEDLLVAAAESLPELPPPAQDAGLMRLAYVSRAARRFRPVDLERVLAVARTRNGQHGVTGALVYFDESFLQFLEGPANRVYWIYRLIRKDPSHDSVLKLLAQPTDHRVFDGLSMAFQMQGIEVLAGQRPVGEDAPLSDQAVHALLHSFVNRGSAREELRLMTPGDEVLAGRVQVRRLSRSALTAAARVPRKSTGRG